MTATWIRRIPVLPAVLVVAALVLGSVGLAVGLSGRAGGPGTTGGQRSRALRLEVLSNRADLISGGDALVQVVLPDLVDPAQLKVDVNGTDVTSSLARRSDGRHLGLVAGLKVGENQLTARAPKADEAHITITNHPTGGPVFAGPQVQPWVCKNTQFGLAPPTDAQCDSPLTYSFFYKNATTGMLVPYDVGNPPPAGQIPTTTTDQGMTVPYIVRRERGAMDRGIYDVAVLADPAQPWAPWSSQPGWNHKVLYPFGGGASPHHSNGAPSSVLDDMALSRGFMVATNSLNVLGQNANTVVAAEAVVMLKEHISETYGAIRYTIGAGCSGGSIMQHTIAANYPGLLDGIQPNCSYQDSLTTANEVADCHLLLNYFRNTAPGMFNPAEEAAVEGKTNTSACLLWEQSFANGGNPGLAGNCDLPATQVYQPSTNPTGTRCTPQDYQVAIWGTRPQDGFAKSPFDNVGVQYGLTALTKGTITPAQFVDLNQRIGATDIDFNYQAARREADPGTSEIAHRTGQVTTGRELANVPIIDLRGSHNVDDIHTDYHSYVMRARLDEANGTHANQIIWTWSGGPGVFQNIAPAPDVALNALLVMDEWLNAIEADPSSDPGPAKVLRHKPSNAHDACFIDGRQISEPATCSSTFPFYGDARLVAGSPLSENVMKCQLKPLSQADYTVGFAPEQWTALQQAFPAGVCDGSKPGLGQQPSVPWLTYEKGPGGQPLGPLPASVSGPSR